MLDLLIVLSGAVNRAVELLKPALERYISDENARHWATYVVSLLIGVFAAFSANVNILADSERFALVPELFGVIVTGLIIGGGSNVINALFDILYGWRDRVEQPAIGQIALAEYIEPEAQG